VKPLTLSQMDCYAGKMLAECMPFSPDIHKEPGMYLQFVEGCGYHVYTLTPDEADKLAEMLRQTAEQSRREFASVNAS